MTPMTKQASSWFYRPSDLGIKERASSAQLRLTTPYVRIYIDMWLVTLYEK